MIGKNLVLPESEHFSLYEYLSKMSDYLGQMKPSLPL